MKIIAATNNKGKIKEIKDILSGLGYEVLSLEEAGIKADPEETGTTFEENALIKARAVAKYTDCAVISDDSGLCVDALGGAPGLYSARYAGENATDGERIDKLLREMEMTKNDDRSAHFTSAVAFIGPDKKEITALGYAYGRILKEPRGSGGFGYDPIFFSDEAKKSFAELSKEEKNKISHRRKALENLRKQL